MNELSSMITQPQQLGTMKEHSHRCQLWGTISAAPCPQSWLTIPLLKTNS